MQVRVDCNVVSAISHLTDLHTLELPDCYKVTDQALPSLSPLTSKSTHSLSDDASVDEAFKGCPEGGALGVAGLTKLDIRSLSHRREEDLTDAGIQHLSALTNLKILNFAGHRSVTSAGLDFISSFTSITDLSLAGASPVPPRSALQTVHLQCVEAAVACRSAAVDGGCGISGISIPFVWAQSCPHPPGG